VPIVWRRIAISLVDLAGPSLFSGDFAARHSRGPAWRLEN